MGKNFPNFFNFALNPVNPINPLNHSGGNQEVVRPRSCAPAQKNVGEVVPRYITSLSRLVGWLRSSCARLGWDGMGCWTGREAGAKLWSRRPGSRPRPAEFNSTTTTTEIIAKPIILMIFQKVMKGIAVFKQNSEFWRYCCCWKN